MPVQMKRIYSAVSKDDGIRILVDRIWPRGVSKEDAKLDYWLKGVAPSDDLRKWFGHDAAKYEAFKEKYKAELKSGAQQAELEKIIKLMNSHDGNITLLFAAKDEKHNQAQVLKEIIERH